jgi:hypothetical protein
MKLRARVAVAAALVLASAGMATLVRPALEGRLRERLEREARRLGLVTRIDSVRIGLWPPIALRGLRLERPGSWSLAIDTADAWWRPLRGARLVLGNVATDIPGQLSLELVPTAWEIEPATPGGWRARLRSPAEGLDATWLPTSNGGRLECSAADAALGRWLAVRHGRAPLLDAGTLSGRAVLSRTREAVGFEGSAKGRGVRLAALGGDGAGDAPGFGLPTDVALDVSGSWRPAEGALDVSHWSAKLDGATLEGTLSLAELRGEPRLDLTLDVRRVEFARLLRTSGILEPVAAAREASDLGSASLQARAGGRLADPASFSVAQRLEFTPPRELPPALTRLQDAFVHEVTLQSGERRAILVSPESPDFVALREVPPLFVRALLLAEDAGFYKHRGVDLAELPAALITNWQRGGAFRGASTLSQQLAKNLFLTREKRLGRKLQELTLALLLEAALGKDRLLEIYLNVIEWGPDLHGLRPAAHHYFARDPDELSAAQMALLVSLIPGPLKYQRALADGMPAPWLRAIVDDLLGKLRSAGALSDEQYEAALADPIEIKAPTLTPLQAS